MEAELQQKNLYLYNNSIDGGGDTRLNPQTITCPSPRGFGKTKKSQSKVDGRSRSPRSGGKIFHKCHTGAQPNQGVTAKFKPGLETEESRLLLTVHLDYLRCRFKLTENKFNQLIEFINVDQLSVVIDAPWSAGHGAIWYDNKIVSNIGVQGGFTYLQEEQEFEVMLDFSGQYFSGVTVENQWRLLMGLNYTFNAVCSRIDIAIDDESYSQIPVIQMKNGWERGENFGFKAHKYIESGNSVTSKQKTYYYGSRNSGKMVRVYNHEDECQRFESEFKRRYAPFVFQCLASIKREWFNGEVDYMDAVSDIMNIKTSNEVKNWLKGAIDKLHGCNDEFEIILQKIMGSLAVSAIDFRDRSRRKDRSKASLKDTTRCSYYQEFIDKIGTQIKIRLPQIKSSIQSTVVWMQRQVSKSISIIRDSLGALEFKKWEDKLFETGREKQSLLDWKLIKYIKENPGLVSLS